MNRYRPTLSTMLIVLPYLLLPAGIWLARAYGVTGGQMYTTVEPWWVVRWSLRAVYIGGAFLGWRTGRPRWFYAWLGFAVYGVVAAMLQISVPLIRGGYGFVPMYMGLALLPLICALYLMIALWLGWQQSQRLLAAYVFFPHAALTIHLVLFVNGGALGGDWRASFLSAVAAAVVAVLFWSPPPVLLHKGENWARAALLFGGVVPAQLLFLIGIRLQDPHAGMETLLLLIPLACLGWLILSGPLLLPTLLQWLLGKFKAEMSND